MNLRRVVPGLFLVAVLIATRAGAATLLPINDDTSAPYLATIDGFPISTNTDGVATWLNRTRIIGEGTFSFNSGSTWNSLATNQPWLYVGTGSNANTGITTFVNEGNGRQMVICVPILVGPPDDSGPTSGPLAGQAVSLALGAAGTYNTYFYQMGQQLVANNLSNAILRLGWEFNGNWYAWKVGNDADAKNFAAFWKQIVNTLRTVPGQNFKYCWSGDVNWEGSTDPYPLADAYPSGTDASGKPYVDYAGTDAYDSSWSYYPWATGSTAAQILAIQKNVWANVVNAKEGSGYWGIPVWQAIAKANNVPFCIPEWGVSMDTHMGGDDTYYVQQMHDFIQTAANNVYFASYYDNEEYRLAPNGGYVTLMPNSAALYRQLFSPPPAAFSATAGNKQVALLWTASTAASSYAVMRATVSGGPYTTVASGLTNTTYTDTGVTNNTPYYYVITPTISGGAGVSTSEVSATPVESFATWAQGVFTSAQLSDNTISAWSDTPAHDGITNLMKYALGLAPMTPATINLAPQVSGGHLTLTFQRLSAPSDITYIVEASSDLNSADWSASGVTTVVTVPDTGSGLETVQATDSATSTPRFMRLRVTSP